MKKQNGVWGMNEESDIQLIQAYTFGRAVTVYYELRNGLTIPELFRRFALSSARFDVVEIVEDVEAEMKTIAGEYTLEEFLDKLDFFWEIISQYPPPAVAHPDECGDRRQRCVRGGVPGFGHCGIYGQRGSQRRRTVPSHRSG